MVTELRTMLGFIEDNGNVVVVSLEDHATVAKVLKKSFPPYQNKVSAIKALRTRTGLGLREAKVVVDYIHQRLRRNKHEDQAHPHQADG